LRDVHVLRSRKEIERIRSAWDRLARSPIQSVAWVEAWLDTLGRAWEVNAFVLGSADEPQAIAPLAVAAGAAGRLELMSVSDLAEPLDLLGEPDAAAALAGELVRLRRPFLLRRLPLGSPAAAEILAEGGRFAVARPAIAYTVVPLDETWADPLPKLSSRRRSDLRRARRRAEQLGEVTIEHASPSADEADSAFDEFIAVEARSWKGEAGTALAQDDARAACYRRYVQSAARDGILRTSRMCIDGRPAAVQLAVDFRSSRWILKIGFDAEFGKASPGVLVTCAAIGDAADAGLATYEFLGGIEDWTRVWCDARREFQSIRYYPPTMRGAVAFAGDGARRVRARV
jgi:CelD/BcsL family acetyltransferase involved in cellulose biosynthesis